jgi:hypothetical protein
MMKLTKKNAWLARTGLMLSVMATFRELYNADTPLSLVIYGVAVAVVVWTAVVVFAKMETL